MPWVCDASAVIALLRDEDGADRVEEALADTGDPMLPGGWLSTVNLAEVHQQLGPKLPELIGEGDASTIRVVPFSPDHAREAAALFASARARRLSLADRACLALARSLELPALTADRQWATLEVGVAVELIR